MNKDLNTIYLRLVEIRTNLSNGVVKEGDLEFLTKGAELGCPGMSIALALYEIKRGDQDAARKHLVKAEASANDQAKTNIAAIYTSLLNDNANHDRILKDIKTMVNQECDPYLGYNVQGTDSDLQVKTIIGY